MERDEKSNEHRKRVCAQERLSASKSALRSAEEVLSAEICCGFPCAADLGTAAARNSTCGRSSRYLANSSVNKIGLHEGIPTNRIVSSDTVAAVARRRTRDNFRVTRRTTSGQELDPFAVNSSSVSAQDTASFESIRDLSKSRIIAAVEVRGVKFNKGFRTNRGMSLLVSTGFVGGDAADGY